MGNGPGSDNILIANAGTTNNLDFWIFSGSNSSYIEVPNIITAGSWVHVAASVDSNGKAKLYVNALLLDSGNLYVPSNITRTNCYLGKSDWAGDGYYNGLLDEVRIWNIVRSDCEIRLDMLTPLTGNEPGLVAYYNFNEGLADSTNTNDTLLTDLTPNHNMGNLENFSLTGNTSNWVSSQAAVYNQGDQSLGSLSFSKAGNVSVEVTATITNTGSGNAIIRGICYGTDPCENIIENTVSDTGSFMAGFYSFKIGNLLPDTTYYFKSYSIDSAGLSYGNESTFKTKNLLPPGNALNFDGTGEYVIVNNNAVPSGNNSYTIEAWINPNIQQVNGIVGWGNWGNVNQCNAVRLNGDNGIINYWWGNDFIINCGDITGAWHHIAFTYDGNYRRFFLDGLLLDSLASSGLNAATGYNMTIGSTNNGEFFNGSIDELRIWNYARTACDIQSNMNRALTGSDSGLVAYYNFDMGIPSGYNPNIDVLPDLTSNKNNAALINF